MQSESENMDLFRELTWSDLQAWAGEQATEKGMNYQDEERVKEIKRTPKGGLVARVQGKKAHLTEVILENGKLSSACTCPAGGNCKHGVAVVLEYLELAEQGEEIPVISEEDLLIARARFENIEAETSEIQEAEEPLIQDFREYLEQLTKQELIEILLEFVEKTECPDRERLLQKDKGKTKR